MSFLKEIGAKWAIVFAYDAKGKLKLHLLSDSGETVQALKVIATANDILDRFTGLFPPKNITPPKE